MKVLAMHFWRGREMAVAGRNQAKLAREIPAWLACPARGAELANTSFPGLTAQILFRPRYTALLTIHFQGCQKNYVYCI